MPQVQLPRRSRRLRLPAPSLAAMALMLVSSPSPGQTACRDNGWTWFGADVLHCPGGHCEYREPPDEEAHYRLSTEPWLRAVEPSENAGLVEGDILVAVNGRLITTPGGGSELANLKPGHGARLTVRRADLLIEVEVTPQRRCGEPLMLVGNSLLERQQDRRRAVGSSKVDRGSETSNPSEATLEPDRAPGVLDFTQPFRRGKTARDLSLGMVVECPDCSLEEAASRWRVDDYPVVSRVVRGGVAEEAGLRVGDQIQSIDGRDLLSRRGGELLFAPPRGDFNVGYLRDGRRGKASINRRIVDQRIHEVVDQRVIRIERGGRGWNPDLLGALTRGWSRLQRESSTGQGEPVAQMGSRRWLVSGDRWGLPSWGVLFTAPEGQFFVAQGSGDEARVRLLSPPRVDEVEANSPAGRAGIEVGDVILEIDGHPIQGSRGTRRLLLGNPAQPVTLQIQRGDQRTRVNLRPEAEP